MIRREATCQLVEAILAIEPNRPEWCKRIANEAAIYLKTAKICEDKGINKAMEYFLGTHGENEYLEFVTSMTTNGDKK